MAGIYKETLKKISAGLTEEQRLQGLMLKKLYQSVLRGNKTQVGIIAKATRVFFPESDVMVADTRFRAFWKLREYKKAIREYRRTSRKIFWYSERVSGFYERRGQMSKAIEEYEFLMNTYSKMGSKGILPLPNGPKELFLLGRWYADKNASKARRFLELYLSAERVWRSDPSLPYKNQARRILNRLERPREVGDVG